jgi:pyruvate,water dikinase
MKPSLIIRGLPRMVPKLLVQPRRLAMMMPPTAHFGIELYVREWRELGLPSYLDAITAAEKKVATAAPVELIDLIESLARAAGSYFLYIVTVAGFAAKAETPLGRFYRQHLHPLIGGSHLELLQGLVRDVEVQPHAVLSLDWYFPTMGELTGAGSRAAPVPRDQVTAHRREAEVRARAALAGKPKLAQRFESLLATAQRFQPLREECVGQLTRAWPAMRRGLARLGGELTARGVLEDPAGVHFLSRDELVAAVGGAPGPFPVAERRAAWERQRRLSPPLIIGEVTKMLGKILEDFAEATRSPSSAEGIRGVAASPGLATGPVRVLRDASDFESLQAGEVLVAQATTPAWTPLFARAVAVVTDTGSIGSHASQVAREYGIPAVVCTVDSTRRLKTGQLVTVDGSAGVVSTAG